MIKELENKLFRLEGYYKALQDRQNILEEEIAKDKKEIEILTKTSAVLKHLVDLLVKDEILKMANLVTYGLKVVFDDQDLTFVPIITKKNEKVHIELKTKSHDIEGELGSFGGSVAVIESFLLRIICLLKAKLARFMLFDETFAAVGSEYIANTSQLIAELSKKLGIDILLVTHQKEFQQFADRIYKVKESPQGLIMERLK